MMDFLSPGPTPKLMGPKSYNQVTRCLAAKVFRGLQICCLARTPAQFDELPRAKVRSVIFVPTPSEITRKTEAMEMASPKVENAEEGAVGGEVCVDPDRHPMAWMYNRQCCYDDEIINFWLLLRPLMDGGRTVTTWRLGHATCYQCGTGPPSHTPCLAPQPQPIRRSGDGCLWTGRTEREAGKLCG